MIEPFEMPTPKVFVNGKLFNGSIRADIHTEPPVPVEDFILGHFDPEAVKVTYRFFLDSIDGESIELSKGAINWQITAFGERVDVTTPD